MVGVLPPGTTMAYGCGTSANVLSGIICTCTSVSIGSARSPTTTVRYCGANVSSTLSTCSGPMRSSAARPGYSTRAIVFLSWLSTDMCGAPLHTAVVNAAERRLRVVLGAELRQLRARLTLVPRHQRQHRVDARRPAGRGEELAEIG